MSESRQCKAYVEKASKAIKDPLHQHSPQKQRFPSSFLRFRESGDSNLGGRSPPQPHRRSKPRFRSPLKSASFSTMTPGCDGRTPHKKRLHLVSRQEHSILYTPSSEAESVKDDSNSRVVRTVNWSHTTSDCVLSTHTRQQKPFQSPGCPATRSQQAVS